MRTLLKAPLALPLTLSCLLVAACQTSNSIFRHVNFKDDVRIELGKAPVGLDAISTRQGERIFRVKREKLRGAKDITVHTGSDGSVACAQFDYPAEEGFKEMVASYTSSLGEPTLEGSPSTQQTAVWKDGRTQLAIVKSKDGQVRSFFADIALCDEKERLTCRCS